MPTRHFLSAVLLTVAPCTGLLSQQPAAVSTTRAPSKPSPDQLLRLMGVDQAKLDRNPILKEAVRAATNAFDRQNGDLIYKACKDACKADPALPGDALLMARFMAAAAEAGAPLRFFFGGGMSLAQRFESGSDTSHRAARSATDETTRRRHLLDALAFSKALQALNPGNQNYRFNVGFVYHELGEFEKAKAIMDELAPRDTAGFGKAHLWQTDQLLAPDRQLTAENLDAAEAHLQRALAAHPEPDDVHQRLGELYYFRYVRYNKRTTDSRAPSRESYLAQALEHFSRVGNPDPKVRLTRAEILALLDKPSQAETEVAALIVELKAKLASGPDDVENRLRLAQAYRMIRQFSEAVNVLREGRSLRPDARYDQETSGVYYFQSLDVRQRSPDDFQEQFTSLKDGYLAFPTNNFITHRFFQALTSENPDEVVAVRKTLQELVEAKAPGMTAPFLLGFDCERRRQPKEAEKLFAPLRTGRVDATPEVVAGLVNAVFSGQVKTISAETAIPLLDTARRVWPKDPDLATVKAQQLLVVRDVAKALSVLESALEQRPNDVKLHEMAAFAYEREGDSARAEEHRKAAAAARLNVSPPKP